MGSLVTQAVPHEEDKGLLDFTGVAEIESGEGAPPS